MLIQFKENEPRPKQLPPFFDLKIIHSLTTYAVCTFNSRVLLLIVVMIATKPRNSQRPTISSHLLGYPPSLVKLRKATEYSSLFFPNK